MKKLNSEFKEEEMIKLLQAGNFFRIKELASITMFHRNWNEKFILWLTKFQLRKKRNNQDLQTQ